MPHGLLLANERVLSWKGCDAWGPCHPDFLQTAAAMVRTAQKHAGLPPRSADATGCCTTGALTERALLPMERALSQKHGRAAASAMQIAGHLHHTGICCCELCKRLLQIWKSSSPHCGRTD